MPLRPELLTDYDSFANVAVEYVATFRQVFGDADGRLTRFLYLGRVRTGGRWYILSIGGGP